MGCSQPEELNPDGFCVFPEDNNYELSLSYLTCRLLTRAIGRKATEHVFDTSTSAPQDRVNHLKQVCEESAIRTSLKVPSTAIFSNSDTTQTARGIYLVSGYVDAQNIYGVMLRKKYGCYFSYSNDNFLLVHNNLYN